MKLVLTRERLAELTPAELAAVAGAALPTERCVEGITDKYFWSWRCTR